MMSTAMPAVRRGQKMAFSFDEDEWTLLYDAVVKEGPGPLQLKGFPGPPPSWLTAIACPVQDDAPRTASLLATMAGPLVAVHAGDLPDVEAVAQEHFRRAPTRPEADWQRHRLARDLPDSERDFPLGAFVLPERFEAVTAERLGMGTARVRLHTTMGLGAAPTEFGRLQDAVGPFHVVLVEHEAGRTVGIWTETTAPAPGTLAKPVLRRLFRMQGAWRYGVKFGPAP